VSGTGHAPGDTIEPKNAADKVETLVKKGGDDRRA
jgi:hypothetical protein